VKVGLALGGGGARGLAHVGVLKVLEEAHVPIHCIAGTSIGAVVGGMYAQHPDSAYLEKKLWDYLSSRAYKESGLDYLQTKRDAENFFGQVASYVKERIIINIAHSRPSIVGGWRLFNTIDFLLEDGLIEETKIPFAAVAVDLVSGNEVVLRQGDIKRAVAASSSIPGFLPPLPMDNMLLIDGAVACPVPIGPVMELGAELVVAVDVSQDLTAEPELENVVDIIFRTSSITARKYTLLLMKEADVVIRPKVGTVHWSEIKLLREMIREGERAAREALPELQQAIKKKSSLVEKIFHPKKQVA